MIHDNNPQPGCYRRQLVKGGVWVACRVWAERAPREPCDECEPGASYICHKCGGSGEIPMWDDKLCCHVDGELRDPYEEWTWFAKWPISQEEHDLMVAKKKWDEEHDQGSPTTRARAPVDWDNLKPRF